MIPGPLSECLFLTWTLFSFYSSFSIAHVSAVSRDTGSDAVMKRARNSNGRKSAIKCLWPYKHAGLIYEYLLHSCRYCSAIILSMCKLCLQLFFVLNESFKRLATVWKTEVRFSTDLHFCYPSHRLCVPPSLTCKCVSRPLSLTTRNVLVPKFIIYRAALILPLTQY